MAMICICSREASEHSRGAALVSSRTRHHTPRTGEHGLSLETQRVAAASSPETSTPYGFFLDAQGQHRAWRRQAAHVAVSVRCVSLATAINVDHNECQGVSLGQRSSKPARLPPPPLPSPRVRRREKLVRVHPSTRSKPHSLNDEVRHHPRARWRCMCRSAAAGRPLQVPVPAHSWEHERGYFVARADPRPDWQPAHHRHAYPDHICLHGQADHQRLELADQTSY